MSRNIKLLLSIFKKKNGCISCLATGVFFVSLYDFCMSSLLLLMDDFNLPDENEKTF